MTRKEFIEKFGVGAAAMFIIGCAGCRKSSTSSNKTPQGPSNINFTVDVSVAPLNANGGYTYKNGVIVARVSAGNFIAVAAACTHQGSNIQYTGSDFSCPSHGAHFDTSGNVTAGPATAPIKKYTTSLSGNTLTVTG
jgi:cytochrome b6-f complex iron-sulfur subunit